MCDEPVIQKWAPHLMQTAGSTSTKVQLCKIPHSLNCKCFGPDSGFCKVTRTLSLPPVGFRCDPYWINNQEVNTYRIWLPGLQPLDELTAASCKYNFGTSNSSKMQQPFHHPAAHLWPSSSVTSGHTSQGSATQVAGLWFTSVLSALNNQWWDLLYINFKQLQVPALGGKSAPQALSLSVTHHSSRIAKMLPWDDPKALSYFNNTAVCYSVREQ